MMVVNRRIAVPFALAFGALTIAIAMPTGVQAQDDEYLDSMDASDYEFNFEPLPPQVPVEEIWRGAFQDAVPWFKEGDKVTKPVNGVNGDGAAEGRVMLVRDESNPNGPPAEVIEIEGGPGMDAEHMKKFENMSAKDFLKLFPMHGSFFPQPPSAPAQDGSTGGSCANKHGNNGDCGGPNNKEVSLSQAHGEGSNHNGAANAQAQAQAMQQAQQENDRPRGLWDAHASINSIHGPMIMGGPIVGGPMNGPLPMMGPIMGPGGAPVVVEGPNGQVLEFDPMLGDMVGMFDQEENMMANMLRAVQPQRDPCEKDLKALCTDTPHKLHCLGKNAKKISTECADEVKGTVPFVCQAEIDDFGCADAILNAEMQGRTFTQSSGEASVLTCLRSQIPNPSTINGDPSTTRPGLGPDCRDAVLASLAAIEKFKNSKATSLIKWDKRGTPPRTKNNKNNYDNLVQRPSPSEGHVVSTSKSNHGEFAAALARTRSLSFFFYVLQHELYLVVIFLFALVTWFVYVQSAATGDSLVERNRRRMAKGVRQFGDNSGGEGADMRSAVGTYGAINTVI